MREIRITDTTLCREGNGFSFKEKTEIAKLLEKLNVDAIELPEIGDRQEDLLLVRTVSSFVRDAVLSVEAGKSAASVERAALALSAAARPRIRIEVPVSPVGMEYSLHKKAPKMLEWITSVVASAREKCGDVEFCAVDATRAEPEFLLSAIQAAADAGASSVTLCDNAAEMLPDEFAEFVGAVVRKTTLPVSVRCSNQSGISPASALLAVRAGASGIKTSFGTEASPLVTVADLIKNAGNRYGVSTAVRVTELHRAAAQMDKILGGERPDSAALPSRAAENHQIHLDANDDRDAVLAAVRQLGYELSDEDDARVFEEFLRVAAKKTVGAKELDAIVASASFQVPATYHLQNYLVNSGNTVSSTAQITLMKDGTPYQSVSIGDGPVDAAFRAIDQIVGHHYELDDFQIQAVTEGKEAMGAALVKLRFGGKLYSGNGISTDIIGAGIRAYVNAVNKIVYEEATV